MFIASLSVFFASLRLRRSPRRRRLSSRALPCGEQLQVGLVTELAQLAFCDPARPRQHSLVVFVVTKLAQHQVVLVKVLFLQTVA